MSAAIEYAATPTDEVSLRIWLVEEVYVPYSLNLSDSGGWPRGRHVTRWIADGYGSVDDAVETYRRHGRIVVNCCGHDDCDERTACTIPGPGHSGCGQCDDHGKPRHRCGCSS